eukprot:superscaffoldBa00007168_g22287
MADWVKLTLLHPDEREHRHTDYSLFPFLTVSECVGEEKGRRRKREGESLVSRRLFSECVSGRKCDILPADGDAASHGRPGHHGRARHDLFSLCRVLCTYPTLFDFCLSGELLQPRLTYGVFLAASARGGLGFRQDGYVFLMKLTSQTHSRFMHISNSLKKLPNSPL